MARRPDNLPVAGRPPRGVAPPQAARGGLPATAMEAMRRKTEAIYRATSHLRDDYRTEDLVNAVGHQRRQDAGRPPLAGPAGPAIAGALTHHDPAAGRAAADPRTVPAAAGGGLPALVGDAAQGGDFPAIRSWQRLRDIRQGPYLNNEGLRAHMRRQHRQYPCFARHERLWEAQGRDPLGMISSLILVVGMGDPNEAAIRRELNQAAAWIRANGVMLDASRLDHGEAFDHYLTEVVLATTDDKTFLLVREPEAANGFEGISIHTWDGGTAAYRDGPGLAFLEQRAAARAVAAPPARLAGPPVGLLPARPAEPAHRQEAPAMVTAPQGRRLPDAADRRATIRSLPAAASPSISAATDRLSCLRSAGFLPSGNQEGPCLRRSEEDGTTTVLQGVRGQPLAKMESWALRSLSQNGEVISERTIDDPEEALRGPSAGPRP